MAREMAMEQDLIFLCGHYEGIDERALVNNPSILIADEPTGNLDPDMSLEIMQLLMEINRRGTTVLVVTHEQQLVNLFDKRVVWIEKGRIVSDTHGGAFDV